MLQKPTLTISLLPIFKMLQKHTLTKKNNLKKFKNLPPHLQVAIVTRYQNVQFSQRNWEVYKCEKVKKVQCKMNGIEEFDTEDQVLFIK